MYVDNCIDCMLKGLNEQVSSMRYNIIDAFVSLVLVTFLLPLTGIKGYVAVICNSEILNFALSLNRLVKVTQFHLDTFEVLIKPLFAVLVSTLISSVVFKSITSTISLTLAIIFTVFSYMLILYALKGKKLFSLSK
jgi:stage V sporulation protein B